MWRVFFFVCLFVCFALYLFKEYSLSWPKSSFKLFHDILQKNSKELIGQSIFMGNKWGNSVRLYFGGSKITEDGDCCHEIKRHLLLGSKVMTNLDSVFKSRNITLQIKAHLVKAMVFLVVMYGCELDCEESLALKKWCFWTVVLEQTLESPLDCKEIQLVLGVPWKDWCWSWNSNTLATSCEWLTHWKRPWCWKGLEAGGEGDDRGWDGWMASLTRWIWVWVNSGSWWWTGRHGVLRFMESQGVGHDWATEMNWTELMNSECHL